MTLLDILNKELEGKKVVGGQVPLNMIGTTILSVSLDCYEPMFEVLVRHPDPSGNVEHFDILDDWDIELE